MSPERTPVATLRILAGTRATVRLAEAAARHFGDRLEVARARNELFLLQDVSVGIEQRHDAGVAPEVCRHDLELGRFRPVLADALRLDVADALVA